MTEWTKQSQKLHSGREKIFHSLAPIGTRIPVMVYRLADCLKLIPRSAFALRCAAQYEGQEQFRRLLRQWIPYVFRWRGHIVMWANVRFSSSKRPTVGTKRYVWMFGSTTNIQCRKSFPSNAPAQANRSFASEAAEEYLISKDLRWALMFVWHALMLTHSTTRGLFLLPPHVPPRKLEYPHEAMRCTGDLFTRLRWKCILRRGRNFSINFRQQPDNVSKTNATAPLSVAGHLSCANQWMGCGRVCSCDSILD